MIALRLLGACVLVLAMSASARADEIAFDDLHGREPPVPDLTPDGLGLDAARADASFGVSYTARIAELVSGRRIDHAGSVFLSLPTDVFWSPAKAKEIEGEGRAPPAAPEPPIAPRAPPRPHTSALLLVRPKDARAAVAAAIAVAGHPRESAALDDMATRARWSAALPELRLRATRLIDESTSLSPTSYDADRTTQSGGVSLWLEARTTWSLDRLVYDGDEVRIEKMQHDVAEAAQALRVRVLADLFRWQRARIRMQDVALSYEQCLEHWLDAAELEISLDVATAGWFTRWRAKRGVAPVSCDDVADVSSEGDASGER